MTGRPKTVLTSRSAAPSPSRPPGSPLSTPTQRLGSAATPARVDARIRADSQTSKPIAELNQNSLGTCCDANRTGALPPGNGYTADTSTLPVPTSPTGGSEAPTVTEFPEGNRMLIRMSTLTPCVAIEHSRTSRSQGEGPTRGIPRASVPPLRLKRSPDPSMTAEGRRCRSLGRSAKRGLQLHVVTPSRRGASSEDAPYPSVWTRRCRASGNREPVTLDGQSNRPEIAIDCSSKAPSPHRSSASPNSWT